MANHIKFDRDEVIENAGMLFWRKGYYSTSTRELQQATRLKPGSLYAAFGSKKGLYEASLTRYVNMLKKELDKSIEGNSSVLNGLAHFLRKTLIELPKDDPRLVDCFLGRATMEIHQEDDELLNVVNAMQLSMDEYLAKVFAKAQQNNELSIDHSPNHYARLFYIQLFGTRGFLKRKSNTELKQQIIDDIIHTLKAY